MRALACVLALLVASCAPRATGAGGGHDGGGGGGGDGGGGEGLDGGGDGADLAVARGDLGMASCGDGAPIGGLADESWTWVDFAGTSCGRGSATGIAVSPSAKSRHLLIYLEGGGACYDAASCSPSCMQPQQQLCAMHLDGYGAAEWSQERTSIYSQPGTIFDRAAAANPFAAYDWVFVPYCTGDFHSGSTVAPYGIHHAGFSNLQAFLARVQATFCDADHVVLAGSSAGGFGTVLTYHLVKAHFPGVRVDLVDDSGPPMPSSAMTLEPTMRAAWGAAANAPPGCSGCASEWASYFPYIAATWPDARLSLLSALEDVSIGPGFGGPIAQPQGFRDAINSFADTTLAPLPNARAFFVDEYNHVELKENLTTKISKGVALGAFLDEQVNLSPAWPNVRP